MAVHKRSYKAYEGALTPRWSRFLILTRYGARGVFQSRIILALFVISFFCPVIAGALLYLNHNAAVLAALKVGNNVAEINGQFFMTVMSIQGAFAFLMTAFIGPNLVAPDLANNALPLYFSRPLSRTEYVLGRASVIAWILSLMTWVPLLLLFGIESTLSGGAWAWAHRNFAIGIITGSFLWIAVLAMIALAISAWVRWKLVAGAALLCVMFATTGFAAAINGVLRTKLGFYLDPAVLVTVVWANSFDVHLDSGISTPAACLSLAAICAACAAILSRRIRAFEVVR